MKPVVAAFALLAAAGAASADSLEINFRAGYAGQGAGEDPPPPWRMLGVGDTIDVSIVLDLEAEDADPADPEYGLYSSLQSITVTGPGINRGPSDLTGGFSVVSLAVPDDFQGTIDAWHVVFGDRFGAYYDFFGVWDSFTLPSDAQPTSPPSFDFLDGWFDVGSEDAILNFAPGEWFVRFAFLSYPTFTVIPDPTCPADRDGDGDKDVQDLLSYLRSFRAREADMDGDNDTDVQDLLAYLRAFRAGC